MAFIQIIEYRTSDPDAVEAVGDEWERSTEGKRTARRAVTAQDRDDAGHFFNIVFFDSYESAMENSALPETAVVAEKMSAIATGDPTFSNLDVVSDRS